MLFARKPFSQIFEQIGMKTIICLRKLPNTIAVTVLLGGVGADDVDDDNNAGIDDDNVVMMVPGSTEVMEWSLQSMSPEDPLNIYYKHISYRYVPDAESWFAFEKVKSGC